jgi:Leucine-rich repeat (LRR) protein
MRRLIYSILAALALTPLSFAADLPADPTAIRAEMIRIRQGTDWNDSRKVREANEQIQKLTRQLEKLRLNQEAAKATDPSASPAVNEETERAPVLDQATVLEHVQKSAEAGRGSGIDLAEGVREQIEQQYEDDRSVEIKNPSVFQEVTFLVVDFSHPQASMIVSQMENYKSIEILVLKGTEQDQSFDLGLVLSRAMHFPLRELYIINFQKSLSRLPESISRFTELETVGLFNNDLTELPLFVSRFKTLTTLYVDGNPLSTLYPTVKELKGLKELGIARTHVGPAELAQIKQDFPDCKVLTQ